MARIWLSLTVELLGGRGTDLWPYPFARWDLSHLSSFLLADQRMITDAETGSELLNAIRGPIPTVLEIGSTQFTFDLGDQWVHRCRVGEERVDPVEVLGGIPEQPMAYFAGGTATGAARGSGSVQARTEPSRASQGRFVRAHNTKNTTGRQLRPVVCPAGAAELWMTTRSPP